MRTSPGRVRPVGRRVRTERTGRTPSREAHLATWRQHRGGSAESRVRGHRRGRGTRPTRRGLRRSPGCARPTRRRCLAATAALEGRQLLPVRTQGGAARSVSRHRQRSAPNPLGIGRARCGSRRPGRMAGRRLVGRSRPWGSPWPLSGENPRGQGAECEDGETDKHTDGHVREVRGRETHRQSSSNSRDLHESP